MMLETENIESLNISISMIVGTPWPNYLKTPGSFRFKEKEKVTVVLF